MNGDIQSTEFHAVAWDANADIVIGGTQDTGTPEQQVPANVRWRSVSTADGGVVVVDDSSTPGLSTRYSSNQYLGRFRRRVYNAANVLQSQVFPPRTVIGGGAPLAPQFYTPVVVNAVTPTRLIIGGANSVYESLDQADTIREIGPGIQANSAGRDPIAYGAAGNADVLYVGSGAQVFVRTAAHPAALAASAAYPGGTVAGIAIDANDPQTAFVVDPTKVYRTTDAGATWTDITGNLGTLDPGTLWSIAHSTSPQGDSVVVGGDTGVFHAPGPAFTSWGQFGTGLPKAPVLHLEYDAADEVLLAGTLGRGAWTLELGGQPVAVAHQAGAQRDAAMDGFELRPGVVVDPGRRVAYVMSPESGIDAVELTAGRRLWTSRAAAKPLALTGEGDLLVSQVEPAGVENELTVVTLDTRQGGERVAAGTTELPPGVEATVDDTLNSSFRIDARTVQDDALVSWRQTERVIRGAPPLEEEVTGAPPLEEEVIPPGQPPQEPTPDQPSVTSGSFRMDTSSGSISPLPAEEARTALDVLDVQAPELAGGERLERVSGPQFLSADGRHVLSSQRIADDRVWDKYQWTIYDRATGERVGGFRTFVSFAPFFVVDRRVVYETQPFVRQTREGAVDEPLKIRAVDLQTGQEVWNHEVRDTEYRGPYPP
jgi:hypothetical protein